MNTEKRLRKDTVFRIENTVIPQKFAQLLKALKKISEVKHRKTASAFTDVNGIFCTIHKQGSRNDRIIIQLNMSRGWKMLGVDVTHITIDRWRTGDICVVVTPEKESMKCAFGVCREWKKAKPHHLLDTDVRGQPMDLPPSKLMGNR
jgi:hypothetical protein